jgi:Domain of unknown function (DUF4384)
MLSEELGFAYSTVNNFFNQKPIYRTNFQEICTFLSLDWREVAGIQLDDGKIIESEIEPETESQTPLEKIWQKLKTQGSHTEKMGLVLAKEDTLAWGWGNQKRYEKSVKVGSYVQFEINLETPGFLLLIQKDTSGQVWCFCPSCFAPQPHLETGKTSLPQEGAEITAFPIEGIPGKEEILAVIARDISGLTWLPQGSDEPMELECDRISELYDLVSQQGNCQVFCTGYMVIG